MSNVVLRTLVQLAKNLERTDPLDGEDRMLVHREGQVWGRWMRPSLINTAVNIPTPPGAEGNDAQTSGNVVVDTGSHANKYQFTLGAVSADVKMIAFGVEVGGWITTAVNGARGNLFAQVKLIHTNHGTLLNGREFYITGVRKETVGGVTSGGVTNHLHGFTDNAYGCGQGSQTHIIALPGKIGNLDVYIEGRIAEVLNTIAPNVPGNFSYARAWFASL